MAAEQSTQTTPETWKSIPGYEGYYEASDRGQVRSIDRYVTRSDGNTQRIPGQIMTGWTDKDGYSKVNLRKRGSRTQFFVHRLVLAAFVGPCPKGMEGCHNDGNPANNRVENLRWDTRSANARDQISHGRHHEMHKTCCPRGHLLQEPNIRGWSRERGIRACLACHRTHANVRRHPELKQEFQKVSDAHYSKIMGG